MPVPLSIDLKVKGRLAGVVQEKPYDAVLPRVLFATVYNHYAEHFAECVCVCAKATVSWRHSGQRKTTTRAWRITRCTQSRISAGGRSL
eukprot:3910329-Alexandrium_andersonii.AAC.1